ncbi:MULTISPECIES: cytidylyltransferase domain-containing protein [Thalassospira]|uniref:Acylneuraminate cytidylyltransferase n=2 Tax=Thalassospira tepidiphila TaxID=393657 RepID=A0A853L3W4_9PROT|nr:MULTISPECIES: acylneuraminate cytidylyltransferase family protein [Thalassospira]MBO6577941.1 acylneuraminate cytidylyltransferase family protein [Thalassospira sp.]MBO6817243.1 acylneuraminate cytidylyltransferase family protein [Thalassospira sp.]NJB73912.1 CMP-N-acetylneuraminic acid synthetase [Thalassospira tepidiphila]OAZ11925.1 hypothetical protein TH4_02275 [Thalassospira tepidiphila MCCC 1A03514]QPO11199.1 acylneuraminate cytidylyltransferase family protein [Thalassospira sp. A40-3|tara:strand:- start:48 stop:761 length:714 start_codon:yes stop_codon:yes gene_type:complete
MEEENAKVVAIIPARGGSKGILRKNVRLLLNKPLVVYSIEAALSAKAIDAVYVSTDDIEIATCAAAAGANVIERPSILASDTAQNHEVVIHALRTLDSQGVHPETVVLLQPTSPLRTAENIDECISAYENANGASAMSICEVAVHPGKTVLIENSEIRPFTTDRDMEARRQNMTDVYQQNGAIYVVNADIFRAEQRFYCKPSVPYLMSRIDSVDIDDEFDFQLAELILKARKEAYFE